MTHDLLVFEMNMHEVKGRGLHMGPSGFEIMKMVIYYFIHFAFNQIHDELLFAITSFPSSSGDDGFCVTTLNQHHNYSIMFNFWSTNTILSGMYYH
jgi:hypothetical protein